MDPRSDSYTAATQWDHRRPRSLVVACSDGRLQVAVDEFLQHHFGLEHYDRLYVAGGAGALAASGIDFLRASRYRRECAFLLTAHGVEDLILLFHSPAPDGPPEATCADYRRKLPNLSAAEIRVRQELDAEEILRVGFGRKASVRTHVFRCEVGADGALRFVALSGPAP